MPITKGAKKALRSSERKKVYNIRRKRNVKEAVKKIEKLVREGKGKEAKDVLPEVYKALDKAAKMNSIKKNTASRKKSRLAKAVKKVSGK